MVKQQVLDLQMHEQSSQSAVTPDEERQQPVSSNTGSAAVQNDAKNPVETSSLGDPPNNPSKMYPGNKQVLAIMLALIFAVLLAALVSCTLLYPQSNRAD